MVFSQPCESRSFLDLREKATDTLTDYETELLIELQDNCTEAIEDDNPDISPCDDTLLKSFSQKSLGEISENQMKYFMKLEEDCKDYQSDKVRDFKFKKAKPAIITGIAGGVLTIVFVFVVLPFVLVANVMN
jgi:hypothetical protein